MACDGPAAGSTCEKARHERVFCDRFCQIEIHPSWGPVQTVFFIGGSQEGCVKWVFVHAEDHILSDSSTHLYDSVTVVQIHLFTWLPIDSCEQHCTGRLKA